MGFGIVWYVLRCAISQVGRREKYKSLVEISKRSWPLDRIDLVSKVRF